MSVPPKRLSSRRKKTRAAHHALKAVKLSTCPKCKKPVLAHRVCANCGYYKGKDILELDKKLTKKELKAKKKEAKTAAKAEKK